jgi:hypothetical protein
MEDFDESQIAIWLGNLKALTAPVGAATRLARMMAFSAEHLKLIVAGRRNFGEEFVRGVEAVTGLPPGWMDHGHDAADIPDSARAAIELESPAAIFRGTAHRTPRRRVLRAAEPLLSQSEAARRLAQAVRDRAEPMRRRVQWIKHRDALLVELRRFERQLATPESMLSIMHRRSNELCDAVQLDEQGKRELIDELARLDGYLALLKQQIAQVEELLVKLGELE